MGIIIVFFFLLSSCNFMNKGYINEYNQYVPKKPKFTLKNKPNNIISQNLDITNIYRKIAMYENYKLIYPKSNFTNEEYYSYVRELNEGSYYIKFYGNGRCLVTAIPLKDNLGNVINLKNADLNPNSSHSSRCYYFSKDGVQIAIESFVPAEGDGKYIISNYTLNSSGDTLELEAKYTKEIYVKEKLPTHWIQYQVNW